MRGPTAAQLRDLLMIDGAIDDAEIRHLYTLAAELRTGCIVEIGSYRGRSTAALAMGSLAGGHVPVYAIDPQEEFIGVYGGVFGPEDRGCFFATMLRLKLYPVIRLVNLKSEWLSSAWPLPVALLFVDGDHSHAGVGKDLECWLPKLSSDATIVFDDALDDSQGPYHAVRELCGDGRWQRGPVIGKTVTLSRNSNEPGFSAP
jgi:hypothetical protein